MDQEAGKFRDHLFLQFLGPGRFRLSQILSKTQDSLFSFLTAWLDTIQWIAWIEKEKKEP